MTKETMTFQAEVGKLLDIVAHSLYSNREIFLRELISNASDACDRLRYEALTKPELTKGDEAFRIRITADKEAKTLTVADNGIGMDRDELIENLGTIARSGTQEFLKTLSDDQKKEGQLIGQFGVGFYASFMVSKSVSVVSRKAGEKEAWRWQSDGKGEFSVEEAEREGRGTTITLTLMDDAQEFLEEMRIGNIVTTYSDHIAIPILLDKSAEAGIDENKSEDEGEGEEIPLNTASALWSRAKSDITAEQYTEFYHHVAHAFDDPWLTLHNKAEGMVAYTNLLFVPTEKPFDLFNLERKSKVKLYVKRVFITDDAEELLPPYLRFMRGIVDSEDLPLNISREMLQHNPVLAKIRSGVVKKILAELAKKATEEPEAYAKFWETFGAVLKEGIYEDFANRKQLLELARFRTSTEEGLTDLAGYVARMKEGQESIYYFTGEDIESLHKSPHLEGFRAKGIEVLLLSDPIDEFWLPSVANFEEKTFVSVTRGDVELTKIKDGEKTAEEAGQKSETKKQTPQIDRLIATMKVSLGDAVKDVRASERLTDSAVCLVADEGDMDINMARLLRKHQGLGDEAPRILEINPTHALIRKLAKFCAATAGNKGAKPKKTDKAALDDAVLLLLDQARIIEGQPVSDPAAFARRMSGLMTKGLA